MDSRVNASEFLDLAEWQRLFNQNFAALRSNGCLASFCDFIIVSDAFALPWKYALLSALSRNESKR